MTGMVVPDCVEPMRGWRAWVAELALGDDDRMTLSLNSLYYAAHWRRGAAVEARCERDGRAPCDDVEHLCGIHACKTINLAVRYLPERLRDPRGWASKPTQVVLGTVDLWGDVVEHEDGWRAQYAYPNRVYVPTIFKARGTAVYAAQARELLEDAYGVPVRVFRRWDDLLLPVAA